jgi:hypothetical protein
MMTQDQRQSKIKIVEFLGLQGGLLSVVLSYFVSSNPFLRLLVSEFIALFVIGSVFTYITLRSDAHLQSTLEQGIYFVFAAVLSLGFSLLVATVAAIFLTGLAFYFTIVVLTFFLYTSLDVGAFQGPYGRSLWNYVQRKRRERRERKRRMELVDIEKLPANEPEGTQGS